MSKFNLSPEEHVESGGKEIVHRLNVELACLFRERSVGGPILSTHPAITCPPSYSKCTCSMLPPGPAVIFLCSVLYQVLRALPWTPASCAFCFLPVFISIHEDYDVIWVSVRQQFSCESKHDPFSQTISEVITGGSSCTRWCRLASKAIQASSTLGSRVARI